LQASFCLEDGPPLAKEDKWACSGVLPSKAKEDRAMAAERDRIVRNNSVANDIRLNLPVSVQMPDGEERLPYGRSGNNNPRLQLPCDYDPVSSRFQLSKSSS